MFTMSDLLEIAVKMEKNGESVYIRAKEAVSSAGLQELLQWMASEEQAHRKWFSARQDSLLPGTEELSLKQMVPNVLESMIGEKTLSLDEVDFSTVHTLSEMLETFIGFEHDTIMFYELLEMYVEDSETREGLEAIIKEETTHVEQLTGMLEEIRNTPGKDEPVVF